MISYVSLFLVFFAKRIIFCCKHFIFFVFAIFCFIGISIAENVEVTPSSSSIAKSSNMEIRFAGRFGGGLQLPSTSGVEGLIVIGASANFYHKNNFYFAFYLGANLFIGQSSGYNSSIDDFGFVGSDIVGLSAFGIDALIRLGGRIRTAVNLDVIPYVAIGVTTQGIVNITKIENPTTGGVAMLLGPEFGLGINFQHAKKPVGVFLEILFPTIFTSNLLESGVNELNIFIMPKIALGIQVGF